MANGVNPWLAQAQQNTANPNQDYQSYLAGLGIDTDPSKVGKFFGGITEEYGEDVGMARAGFSQGMQGVQMQGQQAAMQLGGGQGLASIGGGGFGRQSYGMQQGLQGIGQQYGQGLQAGLLGYTGDLQSAQRKMQSQFRDVAGGLFARDAAGISYGNLSSNETPGEQQYQSQEAWYQLGFPDEASWQRWVDAGSNSDTMGQYGQDPQSTISNMNTTVGLSDIRLKKDINYISTMENGVPIYTFKYKWSDDVNIGTIAQDIEDMIPEAVSINSNGYKMVDYSKVLNYGI